MLTRVGALSVKFQLPDGQSADVLASSIEGFPVRAPEDFLAFLRHCQLKETALKTIPLSLRFLACMGPCIPLLAKNVLVRALSLPPGVEISALLALS
jgi:hypothetical protein